jgi:predicted nucleic acid-binding Zn ribbon protein
LHRQRTRIADPFPGAGWREASPISDVITGLMKKLGMQQQHWLSVLREQWPQIVGEDVAVHSRPGLVEGRTLVVFVDSSAWLNELARYSRKRILENIGERFGKDRIKSLRFKLDPDAGPA